MNGTPQASTPPAEGNALKAGVKWVAKHWPRVRLGHEGVMLNKIERQTRIVEIDARNVMTGETDCIDGWPDYEGDDQMGVKIGDEITNHYYPQPEEPPKKPLPVAEALPSTEPATEKPAKSLLARTIPALITAAVVGPGAGLLTYFMNRPDPPPPPAAQQSAEQPDQDKYGLSL